MVFKRKREEMRAIIGSEEKLNIGEVYHCDNWSFTVIRKSNFAEFVTHWGTPPDEYQFFYEVEAAR